MIGFKSILYSKIKKKKFKAMILTAFFMYCLSRWASTLEVQGSIPRTSASPNGDHLVLQKAGLLTR